MKYIFSCIFYLSVFFSFFSCTDEEFTSDSSCRLSYSADTLDFGCVLADMVTPTKLVKIYNNSGENIRISSIAKLGTEESFQLNINGKSTSSLSNVELFDGDSLYMYVQCKSFDESNVLLDSVAIAYNGNTDKVYLSAVSSLPVIFKDKVIESDTTITGEQPFLIYGTLKVMEGATLTIKGAELLFHNGASLEVNGALNVDGSEKRVSMRYFRDDEMLTNVPYSVVPGTWRGVFVKKSCSGLDLYGADIIGGEYGIVVDSTANENPFYIANSTVTNNKYGALIVEDAFIYSYNSVFANGGIYNVRLIGGKYLFSHCTIANYFSHSTVQHQALSLTDREDDEHIIPLKVEINSSIVSGKKSVELYSESTPVAQLPTETFELGIYYSYVFGLQREDDMYFVKNKNKKAPIHKYDDRYFYSDFHIDSLSVVRSMGDPVLCRERIELNNDIEGKSRVDNNYPDAGAYEF